MAMHWLSKRWLTRFAIPAMVLTLAGSTLESGATTYPNRVSSNRAPECAAQWFDDFSPRRTAELQAFVTPRRDESPVLLFCLGMHKLSAVGRDAAIEDISRATWSGYAPAAEWLGMAYLMGLFVPRDFEVARGWFVYASHYKGKLAQEMLYAFGEESWRRDIVFGLGMLLKVAGFILFCKRSNGFDLRILGPGLLIEALYCLYQIKDDKFLALGGNLETAATFVVAALGANLTAAAIRHDPTLPSL